MTGPLLTVIVPVYNELPTVNELLRRVAAAPYEKQIVAVDDGSTDGSLEVLRSWARRGQLELLEHASNQGKGRAIRTALARARGRFTIIQDADLECDPDDYPALIEPLIRGAADVAYGSRYLRRAHLPRAPRAAGRGSAPGRWGVAALNAFVRMVYGVKLTDEATCYKAFPTALLRAMDLQCERFEFCPEVTAKTCRLGLKIVEVPIHYFPRSYAEGKKIRWADGFQALATLWKWRDWKGPVAAGAEGRATLAYALPAEAVRRLAVKPR